MQIFVTPQDCESLIVLVDEAVPEEGQFRDDTSDVFVTSNCGRDDAIDVNCPMRED